MPLLFEHPRQPPGGHHYPDPCGITIRADTLQALLDKIAIVRKNNSFAPGNPAKEVEAFYAKEHPWLVTKVGETPEALEDPIARWVNRMWKEAPKHFIDTIPVATRVNACLTCEHYHPDHPLDRRRLAILGAGRLHDMGACDVHHWACGLAVLLPKNDVAFRVDGCWAWPD